MKFTAIKTSAGLVPEDSDEYQKVKFGDRVMVEYTKKRNYENHKRFFEFVKQTFDMQEFFEDREVYRKWLSMSAGHFDTVVTPKGATIFLPHSISFEEMDEPEFKELFSKCINVFIRELGDGISRDELDNIILGFG